MSKPTVVFIHGLWMHSSSWNHWVDYFNQNGFEAVALPWPGDCATVAESRQHPELIAGKGIKEIADSYANIIATYPNPPIVIGHSLGGLIAQELLGRGNLVSAVIAIDPAPIKGVWQLTLSSIKASLPIISNPFNINKAVTISYKDFRNSFANTISEKEAKELYEHYTIPTPAKPLFQIATARFKPNSETKANTPNNTRGPLLIISGDEDKIVPPKLVTATYNQYANSSSITEIKSFTDRGHSLVIDRGWHEIAEYSANWLKHL